MSLRPKGCNFVFCHPILISTVQFKEMPDFLFVRVPFAAGSQCLRPFTWISWNAVFNVSFCYRVVRFASAWIVFVRFTDEWSIMVHFVARWFATVSWLCNLITRSNVPFIKISRQKVFIYSFLPWSPNFNVQCTYTNLQVVRPSSCILLKEYNDWTDLG